MGSNTNNPIGDWAMGPNASIELYRTRAKLLKEQQKHKHIKGDDNGNGVEDIAAGEVWTHIRIDPAKRHPRATETELRVGDDNKNGFKDPGEVWPLDSHGQPWYEGVEETISLWHPLRSTVLIAEKSWDAITSSFMNVVARSCPTFIRKAGVSIGSREIMNNRNYGMDRGSVSSDQYMIVGGVSLNGPQDPDDPTVFYTGWSEALGIPLCWRGTLSAGASSKEYGNVGRDNDYFLTIKYVIADPNPNKPEQTTPWNDLFQPFQKFTALPWNGVGAALNSGFRVIGRWPSYADGKLAAAHPGSWYMVALDVTGRTILIPLMLIENDLTNSFKGFTFSIAEADHKRKGEFANYYDPSSFYHIMSIGILWSGRRLPMGQGIEAMLGGEHWWGNEVYRDGYPFHATKDTANLNVRVPLGGDDWRLPKGVFKANFSAGVKSVEEHYTGLQPAYQINPITGERTNLPLAGSGWSNMFERGISSDRVEFKTRITVFGTQHDIVWHAGTDREDQRRDRFEYTPLWAPTVSLFRLVTVGYSLVDNPTMLTRDNTRQAEKEQRLSFSLNTQSLGWTYTGLDFSVLLSKRTWKEIDAQRNPTIGKHDYMVGLQLSFPAMFVNPAADSEVEVF